MPSTSPAPASYVTPFGSDFLKTLEEASGLTRGEIVRRLLLAAHIPSARTRQEVQDIVRIQREQNRFGGLLKKALTERAEKSELWNDKTNSRLSAGQQVR